MGFFSDPSNRFRKYLDKKMNSDEIKCTICNKTADDIRAEYFEYMKDPSEEFEDISLGDLIIMSDKLGKPICAGCYFAIRNNPNLVQDVLEKPEDDVW